MPDAFSAYDYFPVVFSIAAVLVAVGIVITALAIGRQQRHSGVGHSRDLRPFIDTSSPARESVWFGAEGSGNSSVITRSAEGSASDRAAVVESALIADVAAARCERERITARLRELDELDHRRMISPEEYVRARAKVLGGN